MREIRFDDLPADVRKTLVKSFAFEAAPYPLLTSQESLNTSLLGWGTLAASGLGVAALLFQWNLGERYGDLAQQGLGSLLVYMVALATAGAGVAMMVRRWQEHAAVPWTPGLYLFGVDLVDARKANLRLFPLAELVSMAPTHHHQNGAYTHTTFEFFFGTHGSFAFVVRGQDAAESALAGLRTATAEVGRGAREGDLSALLEHDPFLQIRLDPAGFDGLARGSGPAAEGPRAAALSPLLTGAWLGLGLAGAVVAIPVWWARDRIADQRVWSECEQEMEGHDRGYWNNCWDEVAEITPWRAEAHARAGTAAVRHITTVTEARQALMRYGDTPAKADAEARLHELFVEARNQFHAKAAADPQAVAFMDAVLDWAEAHPEPIQVRFLPPTVTAVTLTDQLLSKDPGVAGMVYMPIAPHLEPMLLKLRTPVIVEKLQQGFTKVIPNDVLRLAVGPDLASMEELPTDVPVLGVKYDVAPFGDLYTDEKAHKAYAGVLVSFDVQLRAPGAEPFGFSMSVEPPETFSVSSYTFGNLPSMGPTDSAVYDTMLGRAFDQLVDRTEAAFFARNAPPPEPGADGEAADLTPEQLKAEMDELVKLLEQLDKMGLAPEEGLPGLLGADPPAP